MPRRLPDDRFNRFRGQRLGQKPGTSRLFVAIFPPEEYLAFFRDVLRSFDKEKRNIRNIPVDQIHMTLKFIGAQVSDNSRDLIANELQRYVGNYPKPQVKIDGIQFGFPQQDDPRIVMASVESNQVLEDLSAIVHDKIRGLSLRDTIRWREKRESQFHISLARLKDNAARSQGKSIADISKQLRNIEFPSPFTAEYIDLVESVIIPGSVTYKKLGRIKL